VTGSGTLFTTQLGIGTIITTTNGTTIGTVASIASDTSLQLSANASTSLSGVVYLSGPGALDTETITSPFTVTNNVANTSSGVLVQNGGTLAIAAVLTINHSASPDFDVHGTVNVSVANGLTFGTGATATIESDGILRHNYAGAIISGGSLEVNGRYIVAVDISSDTTVAYATWASNSSLEFTNVNSGTHDIDGLTNQVFGNFTWNCPNQTVGQVLAPNPVNTMTVAGNFNIINTGTGSLALNGTSTSVATLNIGGSLLIGTNALFAPTAGAGHSATSDNINFTGAGTITVKGVWAATTKSVNGEGQFWIITITNGSVMTLGANWTLAGQTGSGRNSDTLTIANGGALNCLGYNILNNTNGGVGNAFTNLSGGTLGIGAVNGITSGTTNSGNIQVTGGRSYSVGGNYIYTGNGVQFTGNGLPATVNNLINSNLTGTLELSQSVTVGGTLNTGSSFDFNTNAIIVSNAPHFGGTLTMEATKTGANTFTGSELTQSSGILTYAGIINIAVNGLALAAGDALQVFNAPSYAGGFTSVGGLTVPAGVTANVTQLTSGTGGTINFLGPVITGAATTSPFVTIYGTASAAQQFAVAGTNLIGNITATAPAGFQVTTNGANYGSTATLVQNGGIASGTLYVRIASTAPAGSYNSQNIVLSSTNANSVNISTPSSGNIVSNLTVTISSGISANNKAYDGTTAATINSNNVVLSGVLAGDASNVSLSTNGYSAAFSSPNVGSGIAVNVSGLMLTGTASGNYTLMQPVLSANITKASPAGVLSSSSNPSGYGSSLFFTETLPPTATGTVQFLTNGAAFDTENLISGTGVSIYTTLLPIGTNIIAAQYAGDSNYFATTNTMSQIVVTNGQQQQADLLIDPGFEFGTTNLQTWGNWWSYGPNIFIISNSVAAHSGTNYLQVSSALSGGINYNTIWQDYISAPGAIYNADGWAFTTNVVQGGNQALIEVEFCDAFRNVLALYRSGVITAASSANNGVFPSMRWNDLMITNQYDPHTYQLTNTVSQLVAPPGTFYLVYMIQFTGDASNSVGSVYFDDMNLTQIGGVPYGNMNLAWSDEFNGNSINTNIWNYDTGTLIPSYNNELEYYTSSPSNSFVTNGCLNIVALQQNIGTNLYTSARLKTLGLFSFTYGRLEWRAKLPTGVGMWPALWMMGTNNVTISWPGCGEIDVCENFGADQYQNWGSIHTGTNESGGYEFIGGNSVTNFNTYTLDWTTNALVFYVDGHHYETVTNWTSSYGAYPFPFNQPFFLIMNLAVGGTGPGSPPNTNTIFPSIMQIDYVRIYGTTTVVSNDVMLKVAGSKALAPTIMLPTVESSTTSNTNIALHVTSSQTGFNYVLQVSPTLMPAIWTDIQTNAGTGGTLNFPIPITPGSQQGFFRIKIQ
jgi:beta-glucanase (GH16 family)